MLRGRRDNVDATLGMPTPQQNLEEQKSQKFGAIFDNF